MTRSNTDATEAASDAESDSVETCSAVAEETGEPCQNPAILATGRCHTHLDFTEIPAADEPDEGEDRHRLAADNNEIKQMRSTTSPGRNGRKGRSIKNTPTGGAANTGENRS